MQREEELKYDFRILDSFVYSEEPNRGEGGNVEHSCSKLIEALRLCFRCAIARSWISR